MTEHDDVITPLLRGAPRLGLALGPASARAGPGWSKWIDAQIGKEKAVLHELYRSVSDVAKSYSYLSSHKSS